MASGIFLVFHRPSRLGVIQGEKNAKSDTVFSSIPENRIDKNSHPGYARNDNTILQQVIHVTREVFCYSVS